MIFATMKAQMLETFIGLKHNLIENNFAHISDQYYSVMQPIQVLMFPLKSMIP
jgi:hypothetical protein